MSTVGRRNTIWIAGILAAVLLSSATFCFGHTVNAEEISSEARSDVRDESEDTNEDDAVYAFLARSAFIGNSVSDGLTEYNRYYNREPLGDAVMLTRVSYSLNNDRGMNKRFLPRLDGVPMQAKEAVKQSGVQNVFICMGTNDLVGNSGVGTALERYVEYINGIRQVNPDITIFIESCTPSRPGSNVSNDKIRAFNEYMKDFCDKDPDMFYIDIASQMTDETGYLQASLASDGSVHLTNRAYGIWADTVRSYIADHIAMKAQKVREENERERAAALENYKKNMQEMEQKKKEAHERAEQERRDAEAAEEERRRYELLNVPDEALLLQRLKEEALDREEILIPYEKSGSGY